MTTRKEIELAKKVVEQRKEIERLRELVAKWQAGATSALYRRHGGEAE